MKTIHFTSVLCASLVALHSSAIAGGEGWTSDFEAAKAEASKSKKDLLADFTGSDWCGWCIKLNKEVFSQAPFKDGVKDSFVLVEVDFPKDKSKLSKETQEQNTKLGEKYGIEGYPTILLCDEQGRPYAKTGYQPGGPEKYVEHLNKLRENKAKRDEAFASAEKAEGVAKAKALIAAMSTMGLDDAMVSNFYGDVAGKITAADPKDETGFGKKLAAKKRLEEFRGKFEELAGKNDFDGALALLDATLKEGGMDTESTQQLMMTRVMVLARQGKLDDALKGVDATLEFAPDSPMNEGIKRYRKNLENAVNKAKEKAVPKEGDAPADKK